MKPLLISFVSWMGDLADRSLRDLVATLPMLLLAVSAAAQPEVAEVLKSHGFPAETEQRVLAGEFVTVDLESVSERDLAVGLSFLVEQPPARFASELIGKQLLTAKDPNTRAFAAIEGEGSLEDFAKLVLSASERESYRSSRGLNLSAEERAALRGLGAKATAVDALVRKQLLARHRAYRASGLGGIPATQRDGSAIRAAEDLRAASRSYTLMKQVAPAVYQVLTGDPPAKPSSLRELFQWSHFLANETPTLALTHAFTTVEGDVHVGVQRQFYVNRGYNAEQAVAGFFPVKQGTLVAYTNHTFTDQVAGFGGSAKRAIGEKLMISQLQALWEKARRATAVTPH